MSDEIEDRKRSASLKFGGFALVAAVWSVNLPNIAAWASPIFFTFTLGFATFFIVEAYDRVVLGAPINKTKVAIYGVLAVICASVTLLDSTMRQQYRYNDCRRFELEIVTAAPGNRDDAASAFQALRCQPTGGLIERWKGVTVDQETKLRKANEAKAFEKARAEKP